MNPLTRKICFFCFRFGGRDYLVSWRVGCTSFTQVYIIYQINIFRECVIEEKILLCFTFMLDRVKTNAKLTPDCQLHEEQILYLERCPHTVIMTPFLRKFPEMYRCMDSLYSLHIFLRTYIHK